MERAELEKLGLTKEQIDSVMAENGKDIKAEREKAKSVMEKAVADAANPLNEQLAERDKQIEELGEKIKNSSGIDEKAKTEIAELNKAHASKLKEMQTCHETELSKLKRETETREFFSGLSRKFITPETARAFEQRMNEALTDKAYEGKNRQDILAILVKGEDGKERADIYTPEQISRPTAASGTNPIPNGGGDSSLNRTIPKII